MINIDLSSVIDGHLDYAKHMDTVLSAVGIRLTYVLNMNQAISKLLSISHISDEIYHSTPFGD